MIDLLGVAAGQQVGPIGERCAEGLVREFPGQDGIECVHEGVWAKHGNGSFSDDRRERCRMDGRGDDYDGMIKAAAQMIRAAVAP